MASAQLLKRLAAFKKSEYIKPLSAEEVSEVLIEVLQKFAALTKDIKAGRLQGEKGDPGKDAYTPEPDRDYLSKASQEKLIKQLTDQAVAEIKANIRDGKDGQDALITDELKAELAGMARELIELPDFSSLVTMEPTTIRNALELLTGDERLEISAVKNLTERLDELDEKIGRSQNLGSSLPRNAVQSMIDTSLSTVGDGFSIKEISGTIDDSNTSFTAATEPTLLCINGAFYQKTGGAITWSYTGGTITLSKAVGTGGSIFGIA